MNLKLKIWRQKDQKTKGKMIEYNIEDVDVDMSFLEMLDVLNQKLITTCYNFRPDLIVLGHADSIFPETLDHLKNNYPGLKIAQWFLDPLNKYGPDYLKNKNRVLDKKEFIDANFLTTSPDALDFIPQNKKYFYIPNPCDSSFETLNC